MKLLVLGGSGYLGKLLLEKFCEGDNQITCITHSNSISICSQKIESIDFNEFNESDTCYDAFINLSCKYQTPLIFDERIYISNFTVPMTALLHCINHKVSKVITIGTCLVPNTNSYSLSKYLFSDCAKRITEQPMSNNISFCNILLQWFYGPDEPIGRFIPETIKKLKSNETVTLNNPFQKRDLIHIHDVVDAINKLLYADLPHYMDLPLGTGTSPTILEIVTYMKNLCKSNSIIKYSNKSNTDRDYIADTSVMKKYHIETTINWKDGLQKIVETSNHY